MAETTFAVIYDGPVLAEGLMPVRDLAPALLALGELFVEASLIAYPDKDPVALSIQATEKSSFLVGLAVHSPDTWDQITTFFSSNPITALLNLKEIVIGGAGFLLVIKKLRNRRITKQEEIEPGMIRLTLEDGTTFDVPSEVGALLLSRRARERAQDVVEPLHRDGVEMVRFESDGEVTVEIENADVESFAVPEVAEVPLGSEEQEMYVEIVSLAFREDNKWRLSNGTETFYAAIEDKAFLSQVDQGEAFHKGDLLRCLIRIDQFKHDGDLRTEHTVVQVVEHKRRPIQMKLDDADTPMA